MTETETTPTSEVIAFDIKDARTRVMTLNISLVIGILASCYFGITDTVQQHFFAALISMLVIIVFTLIMLLNIYVPGLRKIINIGFIALIAVVLLTLLSTQFTGPAIVAWCFIFPLLVLFLLGRKYGTPALIIYNIAIMCVFIVDINLPHAKYDFDYAIRFCIPMLVISILAYYYETLRFRSIKSLHFLNQSLENRVEEKTKALEKSQSQLRQVEKMEAIGLLAGGIAHDFNNQLTGIIGYADLLGEELSDNKKLLYYVNNILLTSKRAANLTTKLLAFARKGKYQTTPIDIHTVILEVFNIMHRTIDKKIVIKQYLDAQYSVIAGDPTQIQNAILNIALNSRDAMPNGGELVFATSVVSLDADFCESSPYELIPGNYLQLCVIDNGTGIDEKIKNSIFEPFFTTKEPGKGTGMGLASVYGTLKSHRGAIDVFSEIGHGTTMKLYFPLCKNEKEIEIDKKDKQPVISVHAHILLVDDEEPVIDTASRMLEKIGYIVSVCRNGKEAIELYKEKWENIDLVILDMVMPELSGKETYLALKKINPKTLTLLSSGYSIDGEAQAIIDEGVKGFIQKPYSRIELSQKIDELLNKNGKK